MSAQAARLRLDTGPLLVAPAVVFLLVFFIYPFGYGFVLSFQPSEGNWLANYDKFFSDEHLWRTLIITFQLSLPVTVLNVGLALPIAFQLRRKTRYQRWDTTLLVIPITLGTVLIAEGMLTYFGPRGWLSQFLQLLHIYDGPIRLTHNFAGVVISLAAYEAAFEQYDYSMASAVAMIMGFAQLIVVVAVMGLRSGLYRGPVSGAKG